MASNSKTTPLFSVVIPLYNKADTIERSIRSVWAQSFKDYEMIVVNDGSTDGSLDVIKRLSQEKSFVIIDKKNGGVSSARNAGATAASGRYIALLDGDDVWYQNHLSILSDAITKHPEIKFFGTGYERFFGVYVYYTIPWGGYCIRDVYTTFQYGQPMNSSTVAVEKELWDRIGGFDVNYSIYEDYEFFFRLGLYTKCCTVRLITGKYMGDAVEQATKHAHNISMATRPHLGFIESRVKSGSATSSMRAFADTQLGLIFYNAYLKGDNEKILSLLREFPFLMKKFVAQQELRSAFVRRIRSIFFLIHYKLLCHCVVWRKRA